MLRTIKQLSAFSFQLSAKDVFLSIASGILLILSFPNFNLWPCAWFGFLPVFFSLKDKSLKQAFLLLFLTGIIFWSGIIYWLVHVTLIGTIMLIVYLSLYFGIFGLIIRPVTRKSTPFGLIFIPAVWVFLEYIRGYLFSGFPWALLGYSQYLNLPVIQIADITGAWGVSFLVMLVNVAIVEIIWAFKNKFWGRLKLAFIILFSFLFLVLAYGYLKLSPLKYSNGNNAIKVSVIQGNIPQGFKWDERYAGFILDRYAELTRQAALDKPDLIIWPEAAIPGILGEDNWVFEQVFSLSREIKIPLLAGAVVRQKDDYFGSALLIDGSGMIKQRYDKLHLVPFGEYIPLKRFLPFLSKVVPIGDITKGRDYTIFQVAAKFAVLDCFEDVFPDLAREFTKKGAGFLVNITNDAWYKQTSAPYQHLQASVFRAVENRRYLARAANTGVSGFIAPTGKIISLVQDGRGRNIFIAGYRTEVLPMPINVPISFYTRYGDKFILACFLIILYGIIRPIKS
jgi:apolipoprotein N-acyltransferase